MPSKFPRVAQCLLQIRPPWWIEEIVQCFVDRHFFAIIDLDFAIEIEVCAPHKQVNAYPGCQWNESPFQRMPFNRPSSPFLRYMIERQCAHSQHSQHPIRFIVDHISNWIRQICGNQTMPQFSFLPTDIPHHPNAQRTDQWVQPMQEAPIGAEENVLWNGDLE